MTMKITAHHFHNYNHEITTARLLYQSTNPFTLSFDLFLQYLVKILVTVVTKCLYKQLAQQ